MGGGYTSTLTYGGFMFNKTLRIKFNINATSPVLGNIWIGREVVMNHKQALKFIELGYAEEIVEKRGITKPVEIIEEKVVVKRSNARRSKVTSADNAE
jgi:hypothetical protein